MRNVFYIKFYLSLLLILFFVNDAKAQLDKKTWLVGGSGNLYLSKRDYKTFSSTGLSRKTNELYLNLYPTIGYFLADNFAIGLKPYFTWGKGSDISSSISSDSKRYGIGPFARVYFMDKQKAYNILTDVTYQMGIWSLGGNGKQTNFSISAGPVIYFNSSVGIEFLLGYNSISEELKDYSISSSQGLQVSIGLQIHLIK